MANPEHLKILEEGVEVWNKWRRTNPSVLPDLSEAQLRGMSLRECDLSDADLTGANLSGSNLTGARFSGARLFNTTLSFTELADADFTEARMGFTHLGANDLTGVRGLAAVHHIAPSRIDLETVFRSRGRIPEAFLRGIGLPDGFILYVRSLVEESVQFFSCFISYSSRDRQFAQRLHNDLQSSGVRCWFAPEDLKGGDKLSSQIDEAIHLHDKLLLVLSGNSMKSEWVSTEIYKARQRENREARRVLFPIRLVRYEELRDWECLDADSGRDLAREVREYFVPDFSNWADPSSYRSALQRLLRDLKAEEPAPHTSGEGATSPKL